MTALTFIEVFPIRDVYFDNHICHTMMSTLKLSEWQWSTTINNWTMIITICEFVLNAFFFYKPLSMFTQLSNQLIYRKTLLQMLWHLCHTILSPYYGNAFSCIAFLSFIFVVILFSSFLFWWYYFVIHMCEKLNAERI